MGCDWYEYEYLVIRSKDASENREIELDMKRMYFPFDYGVPNEYDDDFDSDAAAAVDVEKLVLPPAPPDKLIWKDGVFHVKNKAKYREYVTEKTSDIWKRYRQEIRNV